MNGWTLAITNLRNPRTQESPYGRRIRMMDPAPPPPPVVPKRPMPVRQVTEGAKKCSTCGATRPLDCFEVRDDGERRCQCRDCRNAQRRAVFAKTKAKRKK